jgi:dihydroneopterin aldolase
MITIELHALEIFGRHGVTEEERARGQTFLYDIELQVSDAARSDLLADTVDYEDVAACVHAVSADRPYALLETLASAVADAIAASFEVERVRVRVRKREVTPAGHAVAWTAAIVER